MDLFYTALYFVFGCVIGSFLNVCIYRIPLKLDFVHGRSFCPTCHHQLSGLDMVPIFSWLLLKGRCRYCQQRISFRYPMVELITRSEERRVGKEC